MFRQRMHSGAPAFDDAGAPIARALVNRWVHSREVAAVVGATYELRRRLALMVALQVILRGTPVLIASPTRTAAQVIDDLLAVAAWEPAWGCDPVPAEEIEPRLAESPPRVSEGPHQTLSDLWAMGVAQMKCPGRRVFGLVVVDGLDDFPSYPADLARLGGTAELLGGPLLVLNRDDDISRDPSSESEAVVVPENDHAGEAEPWPLAWVGRTHLGFPEGFELRPVGATAGPLDAIGASVRRLGIQVDPTSVRVQRDHDGAVFGWRVLDVEESASGARLCSPVRHTPWPLPVQAATCDRVGHRAPASRCTCGIYALRSLDEGWLGLVARAARPGVLALVRGWGHVAHHERGWRSQFVQPVALFGGLPSSVADDLQLRYECDVVSVPLYYERSWFRGYR